jgi:hypothetical protein
MPTRCVDAFRLSVDTDMLDDFWYPVLAVDATRRLNE